MDPVEGGRRNKTGANGVNHDTDLIERKFNIRLGVTAVGALLAKLGLTPQKPLQRAYQRDPEAIEAWRLERFPAIARQAKASGGEVYFWDESGFRADTVHGKTWGKKERHPWSNIEDLII